MKNSIPEIELIGAVIRQALEDLQYKGTRSNPYNNKIKEIIKEDAKDFMFSDRLERFLRKFQLNEIIEVDCIRKEAKKILRKKEA